jgi:IS1 family transposase
VWVFSCTRNGTCPFCKTAITIENGLRIYLSGDEDSSDVAEKLRSVKTFEEHNSNLSQELNQINMLLEDTGKQLETERTEHEVLK